MQFDLAEQKKKKIEWGKSSKDQPLMAVEEIKKSWKCLFMSQHGKPRFRSNLIVRSVEQRKQASHQKVTCFGPLAWEQGVPHWERAVARKPLAGLCWFQGETREGRVKGSFLRGVTGTQSIRVCMCKWMWDTRLTSSHASSSEDTGSLKSRKDIPQSVDVEWRREACDWCVS